MNTLTAIDLPSDDELSSKILESCLSLLPMSSHRDVAPGEVMAVKGWSNCLIFPYKTVFAQETSGNFEIDEISLQPWQQSPRVLQSRDRGDRTDLASVDELLQRVVVPHCVDLALTVRNIRSTPQRFMCGIASHSSVVERRESLLRDCSCDRRPLDYARGWWKEDHQRLVDLSEEAARRIEAVLARCTDGSPRQDLHVALY
jgi:hypothetical protein